MLDTALLLALLGFEIKRALLNNTLKGFLKGGIYENYIAETLIKRGHTLHYFKPNDNLELEFIIEKDGKVIPLEVKVGYTITKSLDSFINDFNLSMAIKLINGNASKVQNKYTISHFLVMFI